MSDDVLTLRDVLPGQDFHFVDRPRREPGPVALDPSTLRFVESPVPCAYCPGDGEICNPLNADPGRRVIHWLPPVICPRCGGTGKDPNP